MDEKNNFWEHLSKAGFITGSCVYAADAATTGSTATNPYGAIIQLIFDKVYKDASPTNGHNLKTGNKIPSDIMAEVDHKIDSGLGTGGQMRFSTFGSTSNASNVCYAASGEWRVAISHHEFESRRGTAVLILHLPLKQARLSGLVC